MTTRILQAGFITLACIGTGCLAKAQQSKKPNILFIFPDQYRVQSLGFLNEDPVKTPNLDRLASEGMYCENAVSCMPLSSPYRGMLMTGKYPHNNHIRTNCNTYANQFGTYLREDETCISDVLKAGGYYCGYIGKWHLDAPEGPVASKWQNAVWDTYTPKGAKRHGFEYWCSYGCHNRHMNPYYWINDATVNDTTYAHKWGPEFEADKAIDFITAKGTAKKREQSKPWALFVSINPPHGPYNQVPSKYKNLYQNIPAKTLLVRPNVPQDNKGDAGRRSVQDYFACVTGVDEQIGRILKALEASGQKENTIVVFTADHGEMLGSHGLMQKVVYYEESFRIPFIICWPERIRPGIEPLHLGSPDIMPTLLGLAGLEKAIPQNIDGKDYSSILLGKNNKRPDFALYIKPGESLSKGNMRGLRTNRYTFVLAKSAKKGITKTILFDNREDPYQLKNVASEHPELIKSFTNILTKRLHEIGDPWVSF